MIAPAAKRSLDQLIRDEVEEKVRSGQWKPGHRIPFEHELATQYGCARATVSKALSTLSRSGLIERRRRAGSFVAHPQVQSAVLDVPDIGSVVTARGEAYRFALIKRGIRRHAPGDPLDATGEMISIEGVHHAGARPFGHELRLISLDLVPAAREVDYAAIAPGSWLLAHVPWTDARHRIGAVAANARVARLLDVPMGTACLQLERWTWRMGQGITWVCQIFPGSCYHLTAEFTPKS